MTAKAIADQLLAIEARISGLDWNQQGVNLWPLYRNEVRARLSVELLGAATEARVRPRLADLASAFLPSLGPSVDEGAVVVLNDGFSVQRIGGQVIDRFGTPFCMGLDRAGAPNLLLDMGLPACSQLASRVEGVGGQVLAAKIRGVVRSRCTTPRWVIERCERLKEAAVLCEVDPVVIAPAREMAARQFAMFDLARYFERLLRWHRASRVFVVSYYTVAGFAMNLAASRAGVCAFDIQHGVIDPEHAAYSRWRNSPGGAGALMPDGYWTWSGEEARIIRDGVPVPDDAVIEGGHPFVEAWQADLFGSTGQARAEAKALRQRHSGRRHALVTLQPSLMENDSLLPVLEAMRSIPDVVWWVRGHPASQNALPEVQVLLERTGAEYDLDAATRLPLYALLENVDVHLTHSSSTVIEAANFGVPSILWSSYGEELFPAAVRAGVAQVGETGAEVVGLMRSAMTSTRQVTATASATRLFDALQALTK